MRPASGLGALPIRSDGFVDLVERRFGFRVPRRHHERIAQTVGSILRLHSLTADAYLSLLATHPADAPFVQALLRVVTNNESYFFRDPPAMESLLRVVLPEQLERCRRRRVLRIWSAGCAAGQELYTLSILLRQLLPHIEPWHVELWGTDIDTAALEQARRGEYEERALRVTSEPERTRYFERRNGRFRLRNEYRRGIRFAFHNLTDLTHTPPGSAGFDLILCRNVTIYFGLAGVEATSRQLERALTPGGSWIAAPCDPLSARRWRTRVLPGMLVNTPVREWHASHYRFSQQPDCATREREPDLPSMTP